MGKAASGSQTKYYYTVEDADGNIAATAPVFKPIRFNTAGLNRDGDQIDSEEINPDRQRPPSRRGNYSVAGEILSEMSSGSFDDLLAAALQSEWQTGGVVLDSTALTFDDSDNSINDAFGRFVTAGFADSDVIDIKGAGDAANNVTGATATTVTANKIICTGPTFVTAAAGDQIIVNVAGDELIVGSYVPRFQIVEVHDDVNVVNAYQGCRVNTLGIAAPLGASAMLTFGYLGEKVEGQYAIPADAVFEAATGTDMMVTTSGLLTEDAATINYATDWNATVSNNMEALFALFSREAYSVSNGVLTVEGAMSAYLPDDALLQKFIDETQVEHVIRMQDAAATQNYLEFTLPAVNYTQLDKPVDGQGAIIQNYTLSAGYDEAAATTIKIERGTV